MNRVFINETNPLDPLNPPDHYPNALCNWPKHLYVEGDENGPLRCQARGCEHVFTDENAKDAQLVHYTECEVEFSHSEICQNDHGILKQMHKLQKCLVCGRIFPPFFLRSLLFHISNTHVGEADLSKISGFLIIVRRYPFNIPTAPNETGYRDKTLRLAYEHLKLHLQTTHWPKFKAFMGYSDDTVAEAKLLEDLIKKDERKYWPYPSTQFLNDLDFPRGRLSTNERRNEWRAQKYEFEVLYSKGEI